MLVKCTDGTVQINLVFKDTERWQIQMLTAGTDFTITDNMQAEFEPVTEKTTIILEKDTEKG